MYLRGLIQWLCEHESLWSTFKTSWTQNNFSELWRRRFNPVFNVCGRPPPCYRLNTHPSHNASLANRSVLQSSCVQTFAHVIKPESCVCASVCVYLETPPFVCIFNGSRLTVSQGCGGAGHFSQSQLVGGLLFLCTQLSRRSRPPLPRRPHPGMRRLERIWSGLWVGGVAWGVINVQL